MQNYPWSIGFHIHIEILLNYSPKLLICAPCFSLQVSITHSRSLATHFFTNSMFYKSQNVELFQNIKKQLVILHQPAELRRITGAQIGLYLIFTGAT